MLAEKERLERGDYPASASLVMRNMKKRFGARKVAVKGVSLAIEVPAEKRVAGVHRGGSCRLHRGCSPPPLAPPFSLSGYVAGPNGQRGIVFGLLGPNGAGA